MRVEGRVLAEYDQDAIGRATTSEIDPGHVTLNPGPSADLPLSGDGTMPVPVYDCHVILAPPDGEGVIHGRVTTLPEITARGKMERDVLQRIVKDFKAALIGYRERGEVVPWRQAEQPRDGETQRWIPVHL